MKTKSTASFLAGALILIPAFYGVSSAQSINQETPSSWGLDRIDQRAQSLDDTYQYLYDGSDVDIYILDSGINTTHNDFEGRIKEGISYNSDTVEDCNGHGTHVAGIAAGSTYGVAKNANIIPVKVLNCSKVGSFFDVVNAINWVIDHHDSSKVAVMNLSFATARNDSLNELVAKAYQDNIVVVVGAGNNGANATNYSPASEPTALTVAGATIGTSAGNGVLVASNYGSSIDLYAPSSYIVSAWIGSPTASESKSGTSQAAPFVAGVAALAIEQYPDMSAEDIVNLIVNSSTEDAMATVPQDTVNKLVYSLLDNEITTSSTTSTTVETTTTTSTTSTTTLPSTTSTTTYSTTTSTTEPIIYIPSETEVETAQEPEPDSAPQESSSEPEDDSISVPESTTTSTTSTTSTTVAVSTIVNSPVTNKIIIVCRKFNKTIKGKFLVKLTSSNQKCPKGYRINVKKQLSNK